MAKNTEVNIHNIIFIHDLIDNNKLALRFHYSNEYYNRS